MAVTGITNWYGKKVFTLATKVNVQAMKKAVFVVERKTKELLSQTGTGREYKRGSKVHTASVSGQPPAVDTGVLRASIMGEVKVGSLAVTGKVGTDVQAIAAQSKSGTDVNYGLYHELGFRHWKSGKTIGPRPFLRPAVRMSRKKVNKLFERANGE